jgi:hypothetical protein
VSGRQLRGYAVKLICKGSPLGEVMWVSNGGGSVSLKSLRRVFVEYYNALCAMPDALAGRAASGKASVRIVAIYSRPKRTAEQERADVVAWLRLKVESDTCLAMATGIERGQHVGKADAK